MNHVTITSPAQRTLGCHYRAPGLPSRPFPVLSEPRLSREVLALQVTFLTSGTHTELLSSLTVPGTPQLGADRGAVTDQGAASLGLGCVFLPSGAACLLGANPCLVCPRQELFKKMVVWPAFQIQGISYSNPSFRHLWIWEIHVCLSSRQWAEEDEQLLRRVACLQFTTKFTTFTSQALAAFTPTGL